MLLLSLLIDCFNCSSPSSRGLTPGGNLDQISGESRKQAAVVLEVLAGLRSCEQAVEALGLSLQTYYNLETRALRGLVHGCTPTPPGRTLMLLKQVRGLNNSPVA